MYLSNYHSHCIFCDGRSHPEVFVQHAISKGLKAYGFSSHAPLPFDTFWTMKHDDVADYFQEIERLKVKYNQQIELYAGLEIDYLNENYNARHTYFSNLPTDFTIGSIHYIQHPQNGELMGIDGSYSLFEEETNRLFNGNIEQVIRAFFTQSKKMVELGGFDIVGHVDKIYLNASKFSGFNKLQNLIDELMDDLLTAIAQSRLILEINTKSVESAGISYPSRHYFKKINELQIPITINCDTHYPDNVIQGKSTTAVLLKQYGFTHTMELIGGVWQSYAI